MEKLRSIAGEFETTSIRQTNGPFNWSKVNNSAIKLNGGLHYLLINDDVAWGDPVQFIDFLSFCLKHDVGLASGVTLNDYDTIDQAGLTISSNATVGKYYCGVSLYDFLSHFRTTRAFGVDAVSGHFMFLAKQTYEKVGKFNEALAYDFNDVEFCYAECS